MDFFSRFLRNAYPFLFTFFWKMKTCNRYPFSIISPENREKGRALGPGNIMKGSKSFSLKILLFNGFLVFFLCTHQLWAQRVASVSGNWNNTATWGGQPVPTSTDAVTINAGVTVTVNVINATCQSMVIGSANGIGTLTFAATGSPSLTVLGNIDVGNSGNQNRRGAITFTSGSTLIANSLRLGTTGNQTSSITMTGGLLRVNGPITVGSTGAIWEPNTGTVELTATNTLPTTIFTSFNNLTIASGTTTTGVAIPTISGNLTVRGGATFSLAHPVGAATGPTSVSLENGATGSTISGAGTLTLGGNVTVTKIAGTGAGATISSPLALGATRTFSVADETTLVNDLAISGVISGAFGIVKDGAGTMVLAGANTFSGLTTVTAGTLQAGVNNALASGGLTVNGGSYNISTFTDTVGPVTLISGSIVGTTGILTGSSYAVESGSISAILAGTGGLTKTTTGTVTLSGANTFTGTTSISAGTLQFGASGVLANTSPVSLGGGTLRTGATSGFSEAAGTLALTANSTIALGTGAHNLNFAASNGIGWTAGTTLSITGWTGVGGSSGTAGKIYVGTSSAGLTTSQLAQFRFAGYPPGAEILPDGEIVPNGALPAVTSATTTNSTYGSASTYTITASNFPISFNASGLPTGMTINTSTGVITVGASTPAGTYTISLSATNLNGTGPVTTLTYTVNPALLTITAGNQVVCFGIPVTTVTAAGSYTPTGFVNSETASVISGTVTYTTTYTASTPAGTAGVTITPDISGLTATNYTIAAVSGAITINPVPTAITTSSFASQASCVNATPGFNALSVQAGGGFSYQWYRNTTGTINTGTDTPVGTNTNSFTPPNDGSVPTPSRYYVVVSSASSCGAGVASVLSGEMIINPRPTASFIAPISGPICIGTSVTYTTQSGNSNYVWSVPGTAGTDYTITSGGIGTGSNFVTLTWLSSGTKTVTVNYSNSTGCTSTSAASNSITVNPDRTASASSIANPKVCINNTLTSYTHTTTQATGIANPGDATGVNGLPIGVSATWAGGVITISGTPTVPGIFNYSIPLIGGCGTIAATGTLEVVPDFALTSVRSVAPSAAGGNAQITLTGNPTFLPNGTYTVTYSLSGGVNTTTSTTVIITNGTGTFSTVPITSEALNTIVINSLGRSTDPAPCTTKAITSNNTSFFGICSTVFNSSGAFYVPAGVTEVTIRVWGGGGAGGSRTSSGDSGGGGGGGYSQRTISVIPGDVLGVFVGAGGTAGINPTNGGISYITRDSSIPVANQISTSPIFANGGISQGTNMNSGAAGGAALTSTERTARPGIVSYSGGSGVQSTNKDKGGGGGSSAGNAANGNNAINQSGAVAPAGGGNGGSGGDKGKGKNSLGAAATGTNPGGGGGGASSENNNLVEGGNGGDGQVIITFSCPEYVPNLPCATVVENGTTTERVIIQFNEDCNWTVPSGIEEFDILALGGGGGGGVRSGGGGGAGGLVHVKVPNLTTAGIAAGDVFTITVGNGGLGSLSQNLRGGQGSPSTIQRGSFSATAGGGGGGGSDADGNQPHRSGSVGLPNTVALPAGFISSRNIGGSGGGEGHEDNKNASAAGGGVGGGTAGGDGGDHAGGGGGGSQSIGLDSPDNNSLGGNGGNGFQIVEFGTRFYAAGGGGGSQNNPGGGGGSSGSGGIGGVDGDGQLGQSPGSGGGGSGHGNHKGGNGAKGSIIISYPIARILPVEFLIFTAKYNSNERSADLNWTTAKEWENSHFEIERAVNDVGTWIKVGEVQGTGYSDAPVNYTFKDTKLPASGGNVFYRLKQMDLSGKFSYSVTRAIQVEPLKGQTRWVAYPNPSDLGGYVTLDLLDKSGYHDEPIDIRISDIRGIYSTYSVSKPEDVSIAVNEYLENARPGMYIVQLIWGSQSEQLKLIKK